MIHSADLIATKTFLLAVLVLRRSKLHAADLAFKYQHAIFLQGGNHSMSLKTISLHLLMHMQGTVYWDKKQIIFKHLEARV